MGVLVWTQQSRYRMQPGHFLRQLEARYYVRAEIEGFLRAVDRALERPATIILIGGGAAAVKHRTDDPTTDIDTFDALGIGVSDAR